MDECMYIIRKSLVKPKIDYLIVSKPNFFRI